MRAKRNLANSAGMREYVPRSGLGTLIRPSVAKRLNTATSVLCKALALLAFASFPVMAPATQGAANALAAGDAIRAGRTALFDMTPYNGGFLAVGERGVVMRSKDDGRTWSGVMAPTTRTLVSIVVLDPETLLAVGHGGSIVRSADGGQTWSAVDATDAGSDSILGVTLLSSGQLVAYGSYGLFLVSDDKGATWERRSVISEDFDRHISKIVESEGSLYLVGESGTLARSDDGGEHWMQLDSPYKGSFFGLVSLGKDDVVVFGMRGNVFRTRDGGASWTQIPFESKSALNGGYRAPDGRVVITGNNGLVAVSDPAVGSFTLQFVPEGMPVAKAMYAEDGSLVYVGYLATGRLAPSGARAVQQ